MAKPFKSGTWWPWYFIPDSGAPVPMKTVTIGERLRDPSLDDRYVAARETTELLERLLDKQDGKAN